MRQQTRSSKEPAEKVVQDIRRATCKHYSAEEKIRIVLEGLRGEDSIAELCRREGIAQNLYFSKNQVQTLLLVTPLFDLYLSFIRGFFEQGSKQQPILIPIESAPAIANVSPYYPGFPR